MERLKKTLRDLMSIDSTTGFFVDMDAYLLAEAKRMGIPAVQLNKGGVRFDLGGEGNPVTIASHVDAIGLMVRQINADGTLSVIKVAVCIRITHSIGTAACTPETARSTPARSAERTRAST